ncbi:MAG: prephenate dehydrogenase [Frankiales bacterium]|jgi:prephenate dehydrogenase|nr:prephenate dehydrogenase [Frankiales bacterium]
MTVRSVHIVGTGLIGASVGLALADRDVAVLLSDRDPARVQLASDLGAGAPADAGSPERVDLVLICVPPSEVAGELKRTQELDLGVFYSDVASIKTRLQAEAQTLGADLSIFVGGHPVAGRERGGPAMARADLFLGRPWVLTPTPETSAGALAAVRALVSDCGAVPVELDAATHDATLALISHAPQALASLLAARLVDSDATTAQLAGQGLRDLTRIADSDPDLWAQIARGNAGPLAAVLRGLATDLTGLASALEGDEERGSAAFREVVAAGNAGRLRLPGKHGARAAPYATVPVVVADEPGALARLLLDAGEAGINVEDLSLEHSPGAPVGLCELIVQPAAAGPLATVLTERGWVVHQAHEARPGG